MLKVLVEYDDDAPGASEALLALLLRKPDPAPETDEGGEAAA